MHGSVRSWIHYIDLRSSVETQKEHRAVAIECANCIESVFPMIKEFVHKEGYKVFDGTLAEDCDDSVSRRSVN